jgi:hypothetical protein
MGTIFLLRRGKRQGYLLLLLLFHPIEILVSTIRQGKKKMYRLERKNSLFTSMIISIENPKDKPPKKLPELLSLARFQYQRSIYKLSCISAF